MPHPLIKTLQSHKNPAQAKIAQRYFKTGPGEYGEGDQFWGLRVPQIRKIAKEHKATSLDELLSLLQNPVHEVRLCVLIILTLQYPQASPGTQEAIYQGYLNNSAFINNWDLVDCSAHKIIGPHLWQHPQSIKIYQQLIRSDLLWDRRIAIIANFYNIKHGEYTTCIQLASELLNDKEDLMHKAVGWMLREIGKMSLEAEMQFLDSYYPQMPRTMLRYAIEKFPEDLRISYLKGLRQAL